jgi:hypothetical protein
MVGEEEKAYQLIEERGSVIQKFHHVRQNILHLWYMFGARLEPVLIKCTCFP